MSETCRRPPAASGLVNLALKAVRVYSEWLKRRPLLTKAVTSGLMAALGNALSQMLKV